MFPHLTAVENVTLMARHEGWPRKKIDERLAELVQMTQFPDSGLARYPNELSGGQRQRLSLMRALFLNPQILLLDEPLGALDPLIRAGLQRDLNEVFARTGATVLLVTHDLVEASRFADRVCVMNAGRIVQQGPFAEILEQPSDDFVREFVNSQVVAAVKNRSLVKLRRRDCSCCSDRAGLAPLPRRSAAVAGSDRRNSPSRSSWAK